MPKFKVYATMTTYLSKVIEAVDENDALEQAEEIDGGEFTEDNPMAGGWDITGAERVKTGRRKK